MKKIVSILLVVALFFSLCCVSFADDCDLSSVEEHIQNILFDPQTSGGLLIAVDETDWKNLEKELSDSLPCARAIGHVRRKKSHEKYIFVK
ncbi:MAG: hypothetical protein IIW10_04915 [Spirochaetaceae bacterium]|nr:hypothetical protein [Spirochaetaceae bacterium]